MSKSLLNLHGTNCPLFITKTYSYGADSKFRQTYTFKANLGAESKTTLDNKTATPLPSSAVDITLKSSRANNSSPAFVNSTLSNPLVSSSGDQPFSPSSSIENSEFEEDMNIILQTTRTGTGLCLN